ncbi:amino acid transporter [Russula emetica]|nr:amino acid transporter [Russula emetica]
MSRRPLYFIDRRSQLMSSTARVVPVGLRTDDEPSSVDDNEENSGTHTPQAAFVHDLRWDEDDPFIPTYSSLQRPVLTPNESHRVNEVQAPTWGSQSHASMDERSPLLSRVVSEAQPPTAPWHSPNSVPPKSPAIGQIGQSTFSQTLFNATALLLGIGMLSEPLAFSYAGWICGTLLIVLYGMITCYTAKFLAGVVISDSRVRTYADIGKKAFGVRSMPLVNFMFCFETFSVAVILVTLYADSLNAIIPAISSDTYKLLGLFILIPTVFLPLPFLSYASLLGIVSTVLLIGVVFVDGFSKFDAPGSLWSPATTSFRFCNLEELGLAFGLFMAGFGAHAALPSLARDMAEPHRFGEAMNYAFAFATAVYALIGTAGYLMFGN